MGKMKEKLESTFEDPRDIKDLRQRMRFLLYTMIKRDFPNPCETRRRLVGAYNSVSKAKGGMITAVTIGRNIRRAHGDCWALHAWRRTIKHFILTLDTPELKTEARQVLANLKDKWGE